MIPSADTVDTVGQELNLGVPIPDLYERWAAGVAQNLWDCPIRECIRDCDTATLYETFNALLKHFQVFFHGEICKMLSTDTVALNGLG